MSDERPIFALSLDVSTHLDPGSCWRDFSAAGFASHWALGPADRDPRATGNGKREAVRRP